LSRVILPSGSFGASGRKVQDPIRPLAMRQSENT
jgi:hypothetical protein